MVEEAGIALREGIATLNLLILRSSRRSDLPIRAGFSTLIAPRTVSCESTHSLCRRPGFIKPQSMGPVGGVQCPEFLASVEVAVAVAAATADFTAEPPGETDPQYGGNLLSTPTLRTMPPQQRPERPGLAQCAFQPQCRRQEQCVQRHQ